MAQNELNIIIAAVVIGTIVNIFFCLTLSNTLQQVKPENRKLSPIAIWLLLIPFISLIANFFIVLYLSASVDDELKDRGFEVTEKPGYSLGMGFSFIAISLNLPLSPIFLGILGIAAAILFVQYWMKMNWYKKVLKEDLSETVN